MEKQRFDRLRRLHGKLYERFHPVTSTEEIAKALSKKGYKASLAAEKADRERIDYPIDFVVTWVDGDDPEWQKKKEYYYQQIGISRQKDNDKAKFREWDLLRYWFRAVEKYAPWVRNVFLVTYGHVPVWLNTDSPKLKIIRHEDYIPKEYLPTFSARCIELNLWRIPDLSEHFVYFNDDMYLMNTVKKEDFFTDDLPNHCGIITPKRMTQYASTYDYAMMVNIGECNSAFDIRSIMEEHPEKWFSHRYREGIKTNEIAYRIGYLCGIYHPHLAFPLRKSSMRECNERFSSRFHETCQHRFRDMGDVNNQIFLLWELMHNTFEPVGKGYYGACYNVSIDNIEAIKNDCFRSDNHKTVCLNDTPAVGDDHEELKAALTSMMKAKFPEKSSFEK